MAMTNTTIINHWMPLSSRLVHTTGLPLDQIRLVLSQIYAVILCFVLLKIRSPSIRKYFSFIFGTLLQLYVFKDYFYQYFFLFAQTCFVYWVCAKYRKNCGYIVTVQSVLILSIVHIYRQIINYGGWEVDISTILMVMVCKFSLFAYRLEDGRKVGDKYFALTEEQKAQRIQILPSFYEYIAYIQFLPSAVMGPGLDYSDYATFINMEKQYFNIPNPTKAVLSSLGASVACLFLYLFVYLKYFPVEFMTTDTYLRWSAWKMFLYSFISVTLIRFKYYFAWKLNSCAIDACGLSYEKTITNSEGKPEHIFSKHPNANILIVEGTYHVRDKIANWNMPVQGWLRKCVYERVHSQGQFITFMVSAFWHGFYGGYYFSFFLWFAMVHLAQLVFKANRNKPIIGETFKKLGIFGEIILWLFINLMFSNSGTYFQILSAGGGLKIMYAYKFVTILVIIVPIILLEISGVSKSKKSKSKKPVAEGVAVDQPKAE